MHEVWVEEEGHVDRVVAGPSDRSRGRGVVVVADVACSEVNMQWSNSTIYGSVLRKHAMFPKLECNENQCMVCFWRNLMVLELCFVLL